MAFAPFDLSGKVALVTGGNSGIGLGMAEGLAQAGAHVTIWGRSEDKNAAAEKALSAHGVEVLAQSVDVSDENAVDDAMEALVERFGRLDACFANAGGSFGTAPMTEMPTDVWRKTMQVNLDSAFFTLRAAARQMVERAKGGEPGGALVATSSVSAIMGAARNHPYAASKAGMIGIMKALAVEYGRYQISANSLVVGWTMTDLAAPALDSDGFQAKVLPRMPVRRWGTPEDFAAVAIYLASDASKFHTGQEFIIDGGYSVF